MNLRRHPLQIHLLAKKPGQIWTIQAGNAVHLIRTNEIFLNLFCFRHGFYSACHCNRGSIDHEHNNYRTGL